MSKRLLLSRPVFQKIIETLVELEDRKSKLFDYYFPEKSEVRYEFEKFCDNYITNINNFIKNITVVDGKGNDLPFVMIGSTVEILDLSSKKIYNYRIVPPFKNNIGGDDVSFLSPVGKALLLKKVNEKVKVSTPAGIFCFQIKSIGFPL